MHSSDLRMVTFFPLPCTPIVWRWLCSFKPAQVISCIPMVRWSLCSFKTALQATGHAMHAEGVLVVMFFQVRLVGHWSYHVLQWCEDGYVLSSPHCKSLVIPCTPMVWDWLSLSSPLCWSLVMQCTINSKGVMMVTFFQVRAATHWSS